MPESRVSPARSRIGTTYADQHDGDPASILTPAGLGDGRPPQEPPSILDRVLALPDSFLEFGQQMVDIRNLLSEALERTLWVSSAGLMNDTGITATIAGTQYAYGVGYGPHIGGAVVLRHITVGSDTAGLILLYASRDSVFNPSGSARRLAAVRVTATVPTVSLAITPILQPDEQVLVVLVAASGKLDFACEFHVLRSGG